MRPLRRTDRGQYVQRGLSVYEFFSVVDANHDDPTIFPVLSAPQSPYPFEWEADDGDQPTVFTTKKVWISQYTGSGWTPLRSFSDLHFSVVITDCRVVVYCEKFVKGGGWRGFGVGGLAFAAVANVVSHARAAARRKGKVLVAQVRYPWLQQVGAPADKRGRRQRLRLVVDAGAGDERRMLALDLGLRERAEPGSYAALVAMHAADDRLGVANLEVADRQSCRSIAAGELASDEPYWDIPGAIQVGRRGSAVPSRPVAEPPTTVGPPAAVEAPESTPLLAPPPSTAAADPPVGTSPVPVCPSCGNPIATGVAACGRCGQPLRDAPSAGAVPEVAAEAGAAVPEETTNRALLRAPQPAASAQLAPHQATLPPSPPLVPSRMPPPPTGPPQPYQPYRAPASLPPEVVLVALAMSVVAALLLYPVLRYGVPLIPHLADSNEFVRALAALVCFVFVALAGCGVALILLAVGLWRGSRVCQILTWLLCGILAVAELAADAQYGTGVNQGEQTGVVIGCVVVAVLLALPGSRRYFAADARPVGVALAVAVGRYFGCCAVISGSMLMIAGSLGAKFVWWGVGLALAGLGLLAVGRGLLAARSWARIAATVCYVGYVILGFVAEGQNGDSASVASLIPLGIAISALVGMWLPASSVAHFGQPQPPRPVSSFGVAAGVVLVAASVALAGVGFHESSARNVAFDTPDSNGTLSASAYGGAPVSDGIDADQARSTADDAFSAMSGSGSVSTCGASLPSLPISNYTIDEVTPQTQGTFWVSAEVTLDDGTTEQVSVLIGTDTDGSPCVADQSVQDVNSAPAPSAPPTESSGPTEPSDVPSVPSSGDPVPTDAALPGPPGDSTVVPYTDDGDTPTTSDELVEYEPDGLTSDEQAAVGDVIAFMTRINQQDFAAAWSDSTNRLAGSAPTAAFERGYATSRFYQVAFGQPKQLAADLIVIPARFVSRQDPGAQGNPPGVTDCSYWPQYVFVVGDVSGRWLDDVAGRFASRSELAPLKRAGAGGRYLNPIAQRVAC